MTPDEHDRVDTEDVSEPRLRFVSIDCEERKPDYCASCREKTQQENTRDKKLLAGDHVQFPDEWYRRGQHDQICHDIGDGEAEFYRLIRAAVLCYGGPSCPECGEVCSAGEDAGKEECCGPSTNQDQEPESETLEEGADEDASVEQEQADFDDADGENEDDDERVIELRRVSSRLS